MLKFASPKSYCLAECSRWFKLNPAARHQVHPDSAVCTQGGLRPAWADSIRSHKLRILYAGTRGQIFPGHFQNLLEYFQNRCSRCYSWNAPSPCTLLPGDFVLVLPALHRACPACQQDFSTGGEMQRLWAMLPSRPCTRDCRGRNKHAQ